MADRRRRQGPPRGDLAGRGVHQARDDAHAWARSASSRATPTTPGATRSGSCEEYLPELVRRRRGLHAPVVLADDARHPHPVHAVRRPDRLEAARRAGRDPGADLRHLRRLRADGARRPARRRGADRQREVRVQGPALGRLRARRPQGRASRSRGTSPGSTRSAARTRRCTGCATSGFHHVDDENFIVFSKRRRLARRHATTSSSSSPTSTRTRPARRAVHLDMAALGLATRTTVRGARPHHRPDVALAPGQLRPARARQPSPCTSSA